MIYVFDMHGIGNTLLNTQAIHELTKQGPVTVFTTTQEQASLLQHLDCTIQVLPKNNIEKVMQFYNRKEVYKAIYLPPIGIKGLIFFSTIKAKKKLRNPKDVVFDHLARDNLRFTRDPDIDLKYVFPKFKHKRKGIAIHRGSADPIKVWNGWDRLIQFDSAGLLKTGTNTVAVAATNAGTSTNPAGLIGVLNIEFSDSQILTINTDEHWLALDKEMPGWKDPDFDDSSWPKVSVACEFGAGPWGNISHPGRKSAPGGTASTNFGKTHSRGILIVSKKVAFSRKIGMGPDVKNPSHPTRPR